MTVTPPCLDAARRAVARSCASTASRRPLRLAPLTLALLVAGGAAQADERAELEQLRATTHALIQALVDSGLISPEKAQALVQQAQRARPAEAAAAGPAATPARNVVRIPYVSETAKAEMREQIKQEVLAQARSERWGEPGALPGWLSRIGLEGDVRVRLQREFFSKDNITPNDINGGYRSQDQTPAWAPDLTNTTHDRDRVTLRARLGVSGKLGDGWAAGLRVATGSDASPVSTSQTLAGSDGHLGKYQLWLDRAFVQWAPGQGTTLVAGRFANPFFGTDLSWPSDLNFDGLAASHRRSFSDRAAVFAHAGAFPLQEFSTSGSDKWLYGGQIGGEWKPDERTQLTLGLAYYDFNRIEGHASDQATPSGVDVGVVPYLTSQYPRSVRQKGNTLIRLNQSPLETTDSPIWGLASKFRPIDLTLAASFHHFAPVTVRASFDYIKNTAFDLEDIRRRSLTPALELKDKTTAMQARVTVGSARVDKPGDWQAGFTWRRIERDAWPDAFTDTTWHLGGTNYDGWSLSGEYGIGPGTSLGLRWTSTRNLDDGQSLLFNGQKNFSNADLKIDVLQVELNSRF
ncbi:MAG: putative porin [Pseudomonadota bacterium]